MRTFLARLSSGCSRAARFRARRIGADAARIIVVSIDCYGHEGPFAGRPGWEQLAQTVTGMAHEHAGDEHPALVPAAINDYTTGYLGALA